MAPMLETLQLGEDCLPPCAAAPPSSPPHSHLKSLSVQVTFSDASDMSSMTSLLRGAPKLAELEVEGIHRETGYGYKLHKPMIDVDGEYLLPRLRVLRVVHLAASPNDMSFVRLVLSKVTRRGGRCGRWRSGWSSGKGSGRN